MQLMLMNKEQINHCISVSGHKCFVEAGYNLGYVFGRVSTELDDRKYEFEFAPLYSFKKKQMLFLEIKRLYFDYRHDEKGNIKLFLDVIRADDCPRNDFNLLATTCRFLGQIDGCPHKYIRIDLRKIKIKQPSSEELKDIEDYRERTGYPPPPVFDTVEMVIRVNILFPITLEVDLKRFEYLRKDPNDRFDVIPLEEVAKVVQKELVMLQVKNKKGQYKVVKKKDIPGY